MTPAGRALTGGILDGPRGSRLRRAAWWAADYLYAGRHQLAVLAPPWAIGGRRPTPGPWATGSPDLPEVVLLPGVYEHWTFLRPLGDALSAAGHCVAVVHGLGANRRGVIETADLLARALARTPAPAAGRVLVAHSKGGLIGKHLLIASGAAWSAAREAAVGGDPGAAAASASAPAAGTQGNGRPLGLIGMVAVCAPFGGSPLAGLFWAPSIRAFLPSDEIIVTLGRDTSVNGRIVSVFGRFDPHIPGGSALDGATNMRVGGAGHFRVLGQPDTQRAVREGIALLAGPS